jgi:SAM-dependent methyltransferase
MTTDRDLLAEQVAYYRARAAEYDATSAPEGDPFAPQAERARAALRQFGARGRVLEIAAGTGQWTAVLAETAAELVVTDSSPEMLALNRARTGDGPTIRYEIADAFDLASLAPATGFDAIVFGFFLSHVPVGSFDSFWSGLASHLVPRGRVWFVDEAPHSLWLEDWIDRPAGVVRRTLVSGEQHRAVKVLWKAADLEARLAELGWDASIDESSPFYWGTARLRGPRRRSWRSAE